MDDITLFRSIPATVEGAMLRREPFGAMLAAGNLPILNLSEDAANAWELIDGKRSVAEIERILIAEYADETVHDALAQLIRFFLDNKFITLGDA